MRATLKLINAYFWKTIYGPILSFVFPIMLLGILGNIMRIEYVYPGIISLNVLFIGVLALPLAIMEFKGSSLFKYIGASPVNPLKFSIVIICYYIFISGLSAAVVLISTIGIFYDKVFPGSDQSFKSGIIGGLMTINGFVSFIFAAIFHLLLVIVTGIAIATFSKTPQQALTLSIIIIIPSMFLSGMVITVDIIARSKTMQWISRFVPFRYSTGNFIIATTPIDQLGDIFHKLSISEKQIIFGQEGVVQDPKNPNYGAVQINIHSNDFTKHLNPKDKDVPQWEKRWAWAEQWRTPKLGADGKPKKDADGEIIDWNGKYLKSAQDIHQFIISLSNFVKNYPLENGDKKLEVATTKEIFINTLQREGGDHFLFDRILLNPDSLNNSNNNVFIFNEAWSVRKLLSPGAIKTFVEDYFKGDRKEGSGIIDGTRYQVIIQKIATGDLQFINMFTKQSIQLYSIPERILNLFIPIVFTCFLGLYINKKFTWTSR